MTPSPHTTCQWLSGEPRARDFCGKPTLRDSSYCSEHHAICWIGRDPEEAVPHPQHVEAAE